MKRLTLAVAAAVVGLGVAAQTASAAGPVKVQPTIMPYPKPYPQPLPYPYPYPQPFPNPGPFPPPRVDYDYVVLYKPSFFSPVKVYGRYETRFQAQYAAQRLERNGFPTRIERFRDNGWYGW
jgi:hypothetical protein